MNQTTAISHSSKGRICKNVLGVCKNFRETLAKSTAYLGNGVTVAYRVLGYLVDFIEAFFQNVPKITPTIPSTYKTFARTNFANPKGFRA